MGKITVKHYLNKSTSKKASESEPSQPVYVQVTVKRQVNRMRSQAYRLAGMTEFELMLTEKEFEDALRQQNYLVGQALTLERKFIEDILNYVEPFDRDTFTLKEFAYMYQVAIESISDAINNTGKNLLKNALTDNNWDNVFYVLDYEKEFQEIINALSELSEGNRSFQNSVLNSEILRVAIIADRHIGDFLSKEFTDSNGYFDYLGPVSFYWFKSNLTEKYLNYLINENLLHTQQKKSMQEFFYYIYDSKLPGIEILSGK